MSGSARHTTDAVDLLKELKAAWWLPPFNTSGVRTVITKIVALYDQSRALQSIPGMDMRSLEHSSGPLVYLLNMMRNLDLLQCYLRHRMEKIEDMRWDVASSLPDDNLELLSVHERRYEKEFNDLLCSYQMATVVDITRDYDPPEDNLYIRVNVLQDVETFVGPDTGNNIDLRRGAVNYIRRGDVEHLVRQGKLRQVC
jgi:hypothetical protein